jgi:SAM-dependent methyltransferase
MRACHLFPLRFTPLNREEPPSIGRWFDAVLALSVMTHLSRRNQARWLRELARVLTPGGVLAATVHGRAAAAAFGVTELPVIDDHYLNIGLTGIVPDGYYRDVLQSEILKPLEYMARGIPVIASDVEPYRNFVADGVTGFLVRREHEWLARMSELAADEGLREKMGQAARTAAEDWVTERGWHVWQDAYTGLF